MCSQLHFYLQKEGDLEEAAACKHKLHFIAQSKKLSFLLPFQEFTLSSSKLRRSKLEAI